MKKLLAILLALVMVFSLVACAPAAEEPAKDPAEAPADDKPAEEKPAEDEPADGKPSYKIGLSLEGLDHSYMITLRDQVLAAAEAYTDADVEVIVTDGEGDVLTQANGIEDMLTQGINLLMIEASVADGLSEALAKADDAGVPYMFVGKPAYGTNAVTLVNNDNYEIGKMAGQWIVDYLTEKNGAPKGNVVYITGIPGDTSAIDREGGCDEILEQYPDIKVIAKVSGEYRRDTSFSATQDVLVANPAGTIDVLYGASGETGIGAGQACDDAGRLGEFPILSVDGDQASLDAILEGLMDVAWTYEPCGTAGFEYAMKILSGEKVDSEIIVPSRQIDITNAETSDPAF